MRPYALVVALLTASGLTAHSAQAVRSGTEKRIGFSVNGPGHGEANRWLVRERLEGQRAQMTADQARVSAQTDDEMIRALLRRVEQAVRSGSQTAYEDLLVPSADRARVTAFTDSELEPGATEVVVDERDRMQLPGTLPGTGHRLTVDAFIAYGNRARVATWQLDVRKITEREWRIQDQEKVAQVDALFRLTLNPTRQFAARDFTITAEDLELTLADGSVFSVDAGGQETGLVLIGRGEMRFKPGPDTERGQVRIFSGSDSVESEFDVAYIRAGRIDSHVDRTKLVPQTADPRDLRRAEQVLREESTHSFMLDLGALSSDDWSMLPSSRDFLAEIRTRRFNTLTYIRSASDPEDVSLVDRRGQRNIALYASKEKLESRGRFFDEDAGAAYDVLDYDIETAFSPDRLWIDGKTQLRLRIRAPYVAQLNIRLADSLTVRSLYADKFGYLFHFRAKGQNLVVVNLPATVLRDTDLTLTVTYGGRLPPQSPDRETILLDQNTAEPRRRPPLGDPVPVKVDPTYLYSSRSYWYAQAPSTDYATARMRISVPPPFGCVGSGEVSSASPSTVRGPEGTRREYEFTAARPLRYLAFVAGRFSRAGGTKITFDAPGSDDKRVADRTESASNPAASSVASLDLNVVTSPFLVLRGRQVVDRAADIARFYQSVVGDSPYGSFTLAVVENMLPGGHSPAYFATLNQPQVNPQLTWQNDPADFNGYPEFFLAHEMAHQWWGQAVGWRNYHEQWLSEGIAQYFAALYAQHYRGEQVFTSMLRRMRSTAIDESAEGPVYLGYRLGHIQDDSRVFRALVYNKAASVLHMLRRLIGDEAFFRGLRRFYAGSRYQKGSTEDLRFAMEWESGQPLERFMERWIYGSTLPDLTFSFRVESTGDRQELVLRFDQAGEIFDVPVTVTIEYADRRSADVMVPVTERSVEKRVPLDGALRSVIVDDASTVAEIRRAS